LRSQRIYLLYTFRVSATERMNVRGANVLWADARGNQASGGRLFGHRNCHAAFTVVSILR